MAKTSYIDSVSTATDFVSETSIETDRLANLDKLSASKWGRSQLVALRVLAERSEEKLLPLLAADERLSATLPEFEFSDFQPNPGSSFWDGNLDGRKALYDLVDGPKSEDCIAEAVRSEYALHKTYGPSLGSVWSAMNRLCKLDDFSGTLEEDTDDEMSQSVEQFESQPISIPSSPPIAEMTSRSHSNGYSSPSLPSEDRPKPAKRPRVLRPREQPKQTTSDSKTQDHDHPLTSSQVLETSSHGYVDAEELVTLKGVSEDLTHQFASSFLRHVLLNIPQLQDGYGTLVDFDNMKQLLSCQIQQRITFNSVDDGGLVLVSDFNARLGRILILETKRSLRSVEVGKPTLPDDVFAQIMSQALAMRMQEATMWAGPKNTIFVITAARCFMRFLEVHFSAAFIEELELRDAVPKEFSKVRATQWFNLRERTGRNHAVKNIWGIVSHSRGARRFHVSQHDV